MRAGASREDENSKLVALCVRYTLTSFSDSLLTTRRVVLAASATILFKENMFAGKYIALYIAYIREIEEVIRAIRAPTYCDNS